MFRDSPRGGRTFLHGSDIDSVEDIVRSGLDRGKAEAVGGGDVFWMVPESELDSARIFAQVNPQGGEPAMLGIHLSDDAYSRLIERRILNPDPYAENVWRVDVRFWEQFNDLANFFKFE